MRKTIVVADRDKKLQQGFATIFSKEQYEIFYAPNGKEVEKIAARLSPDIYLVNVNLPKMNGVEVHKKLQKQGYLDKARFFFLKDEADTTELSGHQADGVIEKPINFFKTYEAVTSEDDVIELTDLVEEKKMTPRPQIKEERTETTAPGPAPAEAAKEPSKVETPKVEPPQVETPQEEQPKVEPPQEETPQEEQPKVEPPQEETPQEEQPKVEPPQEETPQEEQPKVEPPQEETKEAVHEQADLQSMIGRRLREAIDDTVLDNAVCFPETKGAVEAGAPQSELEQQFKTVLSQAMEEAAQKLSSRFAPILTRYVEDYVRQMLLEIAEKVIREEIDKLLKESVE
jgi:CheY-like chemotaxis protein